MRRLAGFYTFRKKAILFHLHPNNPTHPIIIPPYHVILAYDP